MRCFAIAAVSILPFAFACASAKPRPTTAIRASTLNPDLCGKKEVGLSDYVGQNPKEPKRLVVVGFGASWCEPCIIELPQLVEMEERYRSGGVEFVYVVIDEIPQRLDEWRDVIANDLKLSFCVLDDSSQKIANAFGVKDLPLLVLLGAEGQVIWRKAGLSPETMPALEQQLSSGTTIAP